MLNLDIEYAKNTLHEHDSIHKACQNTQSLKLLISVQVKKKTVEFYNRNIFRTVHEHASLAPCTSFIKAF